MQFTTPNLSVDDKDCHNLSPLSSM